MSAIISSETSRCVVLLTDGAVYNSRNELTSVRCKAALSQHVPLAITGRGHMAWVDEVAGRIIEAVEAAGFDAAMIELEAVLPRLQAGADETDRFEIVIAGISEQFGPRHLVFRNVSIPNGGPANELQHPGHLYVGVGTDGRSDSLADMGVRRPLPGEAPAEFFGKFGHQIMQFYRECPVPPSRWDEVQEPSYLIGGHCDMTVVSCDGVRTHTLHRWPDEVGAKINPHAGKPKVTALYPGLNRQQRRQAERESRKRNAVA